MAETTSDTLKSNVNTWIDSQYEADLLSKLARLPFGGASGHLVFTAVQNNGESMVQISLRERPTMEVPEDTRLKVCYFIMGYKAALGLK